MNRRDLLLLCSALVSMFVHNTCVAADASDSPRSGALRKAEREFYEAISAAQRKYRKSIAESLEDADDIEVFLLDFKVEKVKDAMDSGRENSLPTGMFPIEGQHAASKILQHRHLKEDERKALTFTLRRILNADHDTAGARCHFPIYGIRIWSGNLVVFQTSICLHCKNIYVRYPDPFGAELFWFDDPEFNSVLMRLMPVPQSEIDRFNASKERFFLDGSPAR